MNTSSTKTVSAYCIPSFKRAINLWHGLMLFGLVAIVGLPTSTYGAALSYSASVNYTLQYTIYGTNLVFTVSFPRFPASAGKLLAAKIDFSSECTVNAVSTSDSGVYLPPFWVAEYVWNSTVISGLSGPGFSLLQSTNLTAYGGGNYSSYIQSASVTQGPFLMEQVEVVAATNLFQFMGSGSVVVSAGSEVLTQSGDLPETPAGYTWLVTNSILSAGIAEQVSSTMSLNYIFQPLAPSFSAISATNGVATMMLTNVFQGETVVLQGSNDGLSWFSLATNSVISTSTTFTDTVPTNFPARIYRASAS